MQMIAGTDLSRRRQGPFLSPIEIFALASIVAALLYLLFPGRDFDSPVRLGKADHVSMAYLRMLLRAHPGDADARLLLAHQQMVLGHLEEAAETLQPLRGAANIASDKRDKAEVLALKLDRTRLYAIPPENPQRLQMQGEVLGAALKLIPRTTRPDDLADLADFVLSLGDPGEAARAYLRLAGMDKPNAVGWLEKAGRWFYAAGDPSSAAGAYTEAALNATEPRQGLRLSRQALLTLLAANQGKAGLAVAKPLVERYPNDLELLDQAVRMAVAAGDLSTARRWGEQRMQAAGSTDEALREQIDLLTKAGDPPGALKVAKTLLGRNGGDSALRRQIAQLARWSGQPEEALAQYTWLARRGNEEARQKAFELSQALSDTQVEVEMLEMRMKQARRMSAPKVLDLQELRKKPPKLQPRVAPPGTWTARRRPLSNWSVRTAAESAPRRMLAQKPAAPAASKKGGGFDLAELILLADAYEDRGFPEKAIKAMDDFRFNFAERPEYWVRIARLYENAGGLEQALACLEQLNRLKAMTLDDALRQAKLLWRMLRPDAALTRLVALRGQAKETEIEYWRLLADLAWRVENDLLASEAYSLLWKHEKDIEIAGRLFETLEALGRTEEAINVAEEAYTSFGQGSFLVSAVDIAVRAGLLERVKGLFAKAKGKEKQFELESHFWFQRAQLAIGEDRPREAEADLQKVLAIDPGSEEAHLQWLTLAVHVQDRGMASRALGHWGRTVESNVDAWGLLADAYALLDDEPKAMRFRKLARDERTRQRLATGRPMTPEEHVEDAIERRDRRSIENGLRLYGLSLSLPTRVGALRELGRDEDAWDLINAAGLSHTRTTLSEDALALSADIRDLREGFLDGAWAWGSFRTLAGLEERSAGARVELRLGYFFLGVEGGFDRLFSPDRPVLIEDGNEEQRAFFIARMRQRFGETKLKAGAEFLPEGSRPHFEGSQRLTLLGGRFDLNVLGIYGGIPAHSAFMRVSGLRDAVQADLSLVVSGPFEIAVGGSVGRLLSRYGEVLTTEAGGHAELAFRLPVKSAFIRPRIDANAMQVPTIETCPPADPATSRCFPWYLEKRLTPEEKTDGFVFLQYQTVGIGLTIGSENDVGQAMGSHVSLRYHLDGWGGYLWPSERPSYAADGSVGLVFARHQEISAHGFYYSDFRNAAGEAFWGGTVTYTLRWFR